MKKRSFDPFAMLHNIMSDTTHGSQAITKQAIQLIIRYAREGPDDTNKIRETIQQIICSLLNSFGMMALLFNFGNELLLFLDTKKRLNTSKIKYDLESWCNTFQDTIDDTNQMIAQHLSKVVQTGSLIGTYSSSGTVYESLLKIHKQKGPFQVICSESRPALEGSNLAKQLAEHKIPTTLTTDALFLSKIPTYDLILVGADSIYTQGLINKAGTFPLSCISEHENIPLYALCSLKKILPAQMMPPKEHFKDPDEICKNPPEGLTIENYYFDITPLPFFKGFITEQGILKPKILQTMIKRKKIHPRLKGCIKLKT